MGEAEATDKEQKARATIGRSNLLAAIETVLTAFQEDPELIFRRLCFWVFLLTLWGLVPGRTDIQNVKLPGKENTLN